MKKSISILALILALILILSGCEITNSENSESSTQDTAEACIGEHVDDDNNSFCDICGNTVVVYVDFYAINDLHGKFDDTQANIGVDELTTYLQNAYHTDDNVVLLSSGDMWQGSSESNLTQGLLITDWMNQLDFVSMTIGNHEFDWGEEFIVKNNELAEFPFLAINIYDVDTNERVEYCEPSVIIERNGAKIGIIGAVGDVYSSISSDKTEGVYFKVDNELTNLVKEESQRLRDQGADFIVYSIHDGYEKNKTYETNVSTNEIASYYDTILSDGYIDLVFEAHTHKNYVLVDRHGVYHMQGGGDNSGISHIEVKINHANETSSVGVAEFVSYKNYANLYGSPVVDQLLDKYSDYISVGNRILGKNAYTRNSSYIKNIVAKLYYELGVKEWGEEYDIALGGGFISVRSPYNLYSGDVKYGSLQTLLPFDNTIVLCSISGRNLKYRFFETSNKDYSIFYGEYGESIKDNIDPDATYYIIVDTFTSSYAPNKLTVIKEYKADVFARDLLADYISQGGLE